MGTVYRDAEREDNHSDLLLWFTVFPVCPSLQLSWFVGYWAASWHSGWIGIGIKMCLPELKSRKFSSQSLVDIGKNNRRFLSFEWSGVVKASSTSPILTTEGLWHSWSARQEQSNLLLVLWQVMGLYMKASCQAILFIATGFISNREGFFFLVASRLMFLLQSLFITQPAHSQRLNFSFYIRQ